MQNTNGTYFFPSHPDYGQITTTLCAGSILAMLSDFSPDYRDSLDKIFKLLPGWLDKDGLPKSDFFFRPVFIGQTTSVLFETIIIGTLYFTFYENSDNRQQEQLRQRILRLNEWATTSMSNEPIHRRIILMSGMPYLFQFSQKDKPSIVAQLQSLINNEPEGKRTDIRSLAIFLLLKIDPEAEFVKKSFFKQQSLSEKIWNCFEQIVTLNPIKAKKVVKSADKPK